jgi:hypothetical protein
MLIEALLLDPDNGTIRDNTREGSRLPAALADNASQSTEEAINTESDLSLNQTTISFANCERLRGEAERLRRKLEGLRAQGLVEDEEMAYDCLVSPFYR